MPATDQQPFPLMAFDWPGVFLPRSPVVSGAFEISDVIESVLFGSKTFTLCAIVPGIALWWLHDLR